MPIPDLNSILPKNSAVILTGLAPGEVLWDTLHARQHPFGEFDENLSYEQFYDFLDCMDKVRQFVNKIIIQRSEAIVPIIFLKKGEPGPRAFDRCRRL